MPNYITTPTISEILIEEFMKPYGISAYRLAQDIHVPVSRIQDILHDRRKITADTSLRLASISVCLTNIFWISRPISISEISNCLNRKNSIPFPSAR